MRLYFVAGWTAHTIVVRDSATLVLQFRHAQCLHYEAESLVKQLGARVRGGNIEGRAAMSIGVEALK